VKFLALGGKGWETENARKRHVTEFDMARLPSCEGVGGIHTRGWRGIKASVVGLRRGLLPKQENRGERGGAERPVSGKEDLPWYGPAAE